MNVKKIRAYVSIQEDNEIIEPIEQIPSSPVIEQEFQDSLVGYVYANGGASDYPSLSNKPSINDVILDGALTGLDLKLVNAEPGKGLSEENFTAEEKEKLNNLTIPIISSVSKDFAITQDKELTLNTLQPDKIQGLPDALANTINEITINNIPLAKANGSVELPIAMQEKLGVVKSSNKVNTVQVLTDGTMEVNSLNISKLVQDEDLILNSGNAMFNGDKK